MNNLPELFVTTATVTAEGIRLVCETNVDYPRASNDDTVIVLVKKAGKAVKAVQQKRSESEQIDIALPGISKADVEYVYLFACSEDGKKASNSVYIQLA